jgi:hypothetical protein
MSLNVMGRAIESIGTMSEEKFEKFKESIISDPDNSANFLEFFRQLCGQLQSIPSRNLMMEIHKECAPPDVEEQETPPGQTIMVNGRGVFFPD